MDACLKQKVKDISERSDQLLYQSGPVLEADILKARVQSGVVLCLHANLLSSSMDVTCRLH